MFDVDAGNLEEGGEVLDRIDDGGASEEPGVFCLDAFAELGASIATAEAMCLVIDEAVPGLAELEGLDEGRFPQGGLVANDIDIRCEGEGLCFRPPGVVGGVWDEDVDLGLEEDGLPLLNDCNGGDEQGVLAHLGLDEAGHLDGLAEPHLVGQDAALPLCLTFEHPANAGLLVLHVLELWPEGGKFAPGGCSGHGCNPLHVAAGDNGRQGRGCRCPSRTLARRRSSPGGWGRCGCERGECSSTVGIQL